MKSVGDVNCIEDTRSSVMEEQRSWVSVVGWKKIGDEWILASTGARISQRRRFGNIPNNNAGYVPKSRVRSFRVGAVASDCTRGRMSVLSRK